MKKLKLSYGSINITTHPHSPENYISLFKKANKLRRAIRVRGDSHIVMTSCRDDAFGKQPVLVGEIFKFTQINRDGRWFNFETNDYASADEIKDLNIPENLYPNSSRYTFIFYPNQHLVFYESYVHGEQLSPSLSEKYFKLLFAQDELMDEFGTVDVVHVPDFDKFEEIMKLPFKKELKLSLRRPNPDTFAKTSKKVKQRMQQLNVETITEVYQAEKGEAINVDHELNLRARVAAKTGDLFVKGRDALNKVVKFSTKKHPIIIDTTYDANEETPFQKLKEGSLRIKDNISKFFE